MTRPNDFPPRSKAWLAELGIHSPAELAGRDLVEVYMALKARRPKEVSLNMLWGLASWVLGCHWLDLPPDLKADLRRRVEAATRSASKDAPRP